MKAALRMALHAVRNTYLEELHAAGSISQAQMKRLMQEVVNGIYTMLKIPLTLEFVWLPSGWDEPKLKAGGYPSGFSVIQRFLNSVSVEEKAKIIDMLHSAGDMETCMALSSKKWEKRTKRSSKKQKHSHTSKEGSEGI